MNLGDTLHHSSRLVVSSTNWSVILALSLLLLNSATAVARQSVSAKKSPQQSSKTLPQLKEAKELLTQGLLEQAKEKAQEELQRNPSSVECYNLLGIIFSGQKDYGNALKSFLQALKLDPNSTGTRNNLGNLYVELGSSFKACRKDLSAFP